MQGAQGSTTSERVCLTGDMRLDDLGAREDPPRLRAPPRHHHNLRNGAHRDGCQARDGVHGALMRAERPERRMHLVAALAQRLPVDPAGLRPTVEETSPSAAATLNGSTSNWYRNRHFSDDTIRWHTGSPACIASDLFFFGNGGCIFQRSLGALAKTCRQIKGPSAE